MGGSRIASRFAWAGTWNRVQGRWVPGGKLFLLNSCDRQRGDDEERCYAVHPMAVVTAHPYNYELPANLNQLALVIIDMQRDFLEPGGFGDALGNDVTRLQAIVPALKVLLDTFRARALPIFHTLECHRPDLSDCPPAKRRRGNGSLRIGDEGPMGRILVVGEPGNAIIPELAPEPGEMIIEKPGKGAFYATPLEALLQEKGITHLLITGVTTEVCVQTTMREANDRGYECLLVEDCTESYFPQFKQATLDMVRAQGGIVGWTAPSSAVMEALNAMTIHAANPALHGSGLM